MCIRDRYIYRPTRPDSLVNVYKAPDKKGSGFYPALERIDLIRCV